MRQRFHICQVVDRDHFQIFTALHGPKCQTPDASESIDGNPLHHVLVLNREYFRNSDLVVQRGGFVFDGFFERIVDQ